MTNNTTSYLDDEITKKYKKKLDIYEKYLFRLKEKEKKDAEWVILGQIMT